MNAHIQTTKDLGRRAATARWRSRSPRRRQPAHKVPLSTKGDATRAGEASRGLKIRNPVEVTWHVAPLATTCEHASEASPGLERRNPIEKNDSFPENVVFLN